MKKKHLRSKIPGLLPLQLLCLIFILIFILIPETVSSQYITDSSINWETGIFSLTLEKEREKTLYNRPASFYATELNIRQAATRIIFDRLLDIQIDSYNNLGDLARNDPSLLRTVDLLSAQATMEEIVPDLEMNSIRGHFTLNLYPALTGELVRHNNAFLMEEVLEWQPGSQYTGVVIYAKRRLPVHGEDETAILKPALFPVLYDENMRLLVDRNRMNPEYVRNWGGAAYSTSFSENEERVGTNPFRILAVGVFGITHSDPLIPVQDANILLHSASNRKLLQEGRILIIISDELD